MCLPAGFTGTHCEVDVDDCAGATCNNGGTCVDGANDFTCACAAGWGGPTCAVDLDRCAQAPCLNGGACTNGWGTYACSCAPGFTGDDCEIDVDDCAARPCSNGGVCVDGVAHRTCACAPGFTGADCETDIDDCATNPCHNGGACTDGVDQYACACPPGFTGADCRLSTARTVILTGVLRDFPAGASVFPVVSNDFIGNCPACTLLLRDHHTIEGASPRLMQLWSDVPGLNQRAPHSITLSNAGQADPDTLVFDSAAFHPADGRLFGNEGRAHNEEFSYELATTIVYQPGMRLRVATPDTVYVFIEEIGTHQPRASDGLIDMDAFASAYGIATGRTLSLHIFYAHGPGTVPRLSIELSGPPVCSIRGLGAMDPIDASALELHGAAVPAPDGVVRLVSAAAAPSAGAAWDTRPADVAHGFAVEFDYRFLPTGHTFPPTLGAGFAFVVAPARGVGGPGYGLGYNGLGPVVAVEFDLRQDFVMADPVLGHVSVHASATGAGAATETNSVLRTQPEDSSSIVGIRGQGAGEWIHARIEYDHRPGEPEARIRVQTDPRSIGRGPPAYVDIWGVVPDLFAPLRGPLYMGFTASTDTGAQSPIEIAGWRFAEMPSAARTVALASPAPITVHDANQIDVVPRSSRGALVGSGYAACFESVLTSGAMSSPPRVVDQTDGSYGVTYAPGVVGDWSLSVQCGGQEISGGPFSIAVSP